MIGKYAYQMKFDKFEKSNNGPNVSQKSRSDPTLCDEPAVMLVSDLPTNDCISLAIGGVTDMAGHVTVQRVHSGRRLEATVVMLA